MSYRYLDTPNYNHSRHQRPSSLYRHHVHEYNNDLQYQQHYRQQQAYYDYLRKHHTQQQQQQHHHRSPRLTHSLSANTDTYYHDNDRDYDWYHYENQHVPPQQPPQPRKRKNSKCARKVILDEDGIPLTDLEILALENAAKNERESKLIYQEDNDTMLHHPQEEEQGIIEGDDLSSVMESLNIENSSSTTTTTTTNSSIIDNDDSVIKAPNNNSTTKSKKKRWPFSFLFKKENKQSPTITNTTMNSSSIPPTPVLSPDNSDSALFPSISSSLSSSPFPPPVEESGSWALKYPLVPMTANSTTVWIQFDKENQYKIFQHLKTQQKDDVVEFTDSHICGGKLPIAVVPIQMKCYIPTDMTANHIASFDLHFIPK